MNDFLEQIVTRVSATNFRKQYDFRIEFSAVMGIEIPPPPDLILYVTENSYTPTEIETEDVLLGARKRKRVTGVVPISYSMTIRDDQRETFGQWFDEIAGRVSNPDGTMNPPYHPQKGWLVKMKRFRLIYDLEDNITEELADSHEVMFTQRGEVSESVEGKEFLTYPITVEQFRG